MPIPQRRTDEDKTDFLSRCMSDPKMNKEYPENARRYAVCNQNAKGSKGDQVKDAYYEQNFGFTEELTEANLQSPNHEEYVSVDEVYFEQEECEEIDIALAKPGLWENIRKKKEREGKKYKPAKPGDPDRPKKDAWKKAQSKYKYKDIETNEVFLYERMGVYRKNGRVLIYIGKANEDESGMQISQIKKMADQLATLTKILASIPVEFQEWTKDHISKAEYYIQSVYDAVLYPGEKEEEDITETEIDTEDDAEVMKKELFERETDILEYASDYQGRKVTLNKPFRTPKGPKKFSVYVKNDKGNIVKVNFGDPNMKIKKNIPERRKSFRARHQCDTNPGPKWKARYWSCRMW